MRSLEIAKFIDPAVEMSVEQQLQFNGEFMGALGFSMPELEDDQYANLASNIDRVNQDSTQEGWRLVASPVFPSQSMMVGRTAILENARRRWPKPFAGTKEKLLVPAKPEGLFIEDKPARARSYGKLLENPLSFDWIRGVGRDYTAAAGMFYKSDDSSSRVRDLKNAKNAGFFTVRSDYITFLDNPQRTAPHPIRDSGNRRAAVGGDGMKWTFNIVDTQPLHDVYGIEPVERQSLPDAWELFVKKAKRTATPEMLLAVQALRGVAGYSRDAAAQYSEIANESVWRESRPNGRSGGPTVQRLLEVATVSSWNSEGRVVLDSVRPYWHDEHLALRGMENGLALSA